MAISFVAVSGIVTGSNPTVAIPAGVVENDFLVIIFSGTTTPATPAGWTSRAAQGAGNFITIFYRFAGATNASQALSVTSTTARTVMLAYRGVSATDTISTFTTATGVTSTTTASFSRTYADEFVISIYAANNVAGTFTAPASTTTRSIIQPNANFTGQIIVDELYTAAGATTSRTATITGAHTLSCVAFSIIPGGDHYWVGGTGTWNTTSTTPWSFTSGGASGAPPPGPVDSVFFDQAGAYSVTLTGALVCGNITTSGGPVTFTSTGTLTSSGSMSLAAGTVWNATGAMTFSSISSGKTITTNGTTINSPITFNGVGGAWSLGSALTTGATLTTTLTNGTLNLNGFDLTTGIFSSTNTNTRSIVFGTNNIILTHTTAAQTVLNMATATGFTYTGTGGFTAAAAVTRTYVFGTTGGSATIAPNLTLTGSGTAVQTLTTGSWFDNLDFGSTAFNPGTTALNIAGNLILSSGGTFTAVTPTMVGTGVIVSNGRTLAGLIINSVSGTTTFGDAPTLVTNSTVTLTSGTLDLNSFNLTTGIFSSSVATTRSIIFGTSSIILNHTTAAQTVLNMATATGFTYTGTGGFRSDAAVTRTYVFGTTGGSATIAPNLTLTGSGTAVQTFTTASWFDNLDFGSTAFTIPATALNIAGSLTLSSGGTFTGLSAAMIGTDSRTITPNGKTIAAFSVNIGAGTLTLAGALGVTTYTQTSGTVDFATFNLTGSGAAAYTAGTLNNIGTITCTTWTVTGTFSFTQGTLTPSTSFVLTSGSFTYDPGATLSAVPTFTQTAGTVTLNQAYALTATGTYTLTAGTLTLGGNLTTGSFSSTNTNTRAIQFGSNDIVLAHTTAAQTVLNMATATGFTYTGTGGFRSDAAVTRTYVFGTTGGTSVNAPNLSLTGSGTAIATITTASWFGVLDFGTTAFAIPATAINVDSISLSSSGTYTSLSVTMRGDGTFTPNGKTIAAFTVNHAGTTTLTGALGCTTYTQTAGTIDFATFNLTCSGAVSYTGGTLSNIGTITCTTFTINGPTFSFSSGTINPSTSFVLTAGSFTLGVDANLGSVPTFTHTAGTVTLGKSYSLTSTGTYTLVAGTLTITDKNLVTSAFITTGTATRAINFGTSGYGEITLTGNAKTIWDGGGAGISYTGTPRIVANYTGATGTRTVNLGTAWTEATSFDVSVHGDSYPGIYGFQIISTGGNPTDIVAISGVVKDFNLNTFSFTVTPGAMTVYGDFTIPAAVFGGTISASASVITFASTNAGARTISIDRNIDFPLTFNGIGGSWNLENNLTTGVTRTTTLTNGTLNLNGNNLTTGLFSSSGATARSIVFGTNSITVTGTGTVWNTSTITNLTITGTPVVNVTNATATATTVNPGALSESNSISFNFTAGTYALTFLGTAGHTAKNVNFTGFAGTLGATAAVTIYGDYTVSSGMTVTASANILTFGATSGTKTIISNGKTTMPGLNINGLGGTFELGDSYTAGVGGLRSITVTAGTFNTNSFAIAFLSLTSTGSIVRAINLGSSTIILNGIISLNSTNLSFDAGTSSITNNTTTENLTALGLNFYDVSYPLSTTGPNISASGFRNLSLTGPGTVIGLNFITWGENTTISGTLTIRGNSAKKRKILDGGLTTIRTITAANVDLTDIDIRSINAQGNIPWTGTRLSDLGNNSNISFSPKTVYLSTTVNSAGGISWDDNIWATSPGGTPDANNYPLVQDTAVITNSGWNSSLSANTVDISSSDLLGNVDFSGRTLGMTFLVNSISAAGNITYGSGMTLAGSGTITLIGYSQSLNFAGKTIPNNLNIDVGTGTVSLAADVTLSTTTSITHTSGTLDLNGFNITTTSYISNPATPNTRQVIFGTNNISLRSTGVLNVPNATNWSFTGTGGFVAVAIAAQSFTFGTTGGSTSNAPNLSISPAGTNINVIHTFTTGSWFNDLSFSTNYIGTPAVSTLNIAGDLVLTGGTLTGLTIQMQDTGTITSNTKTLAAVSVLGGTTTLGGTLTSTGAFTVNNGTFTNPTGAILNATTITLTNSGTINLDGGTLPTTTAFNHTLGTTNVTVSTSLAATGTYTFTAGTLTLSDGANLTTGIFSSTNTNTRSIAFGDTTVGNINLAHTTAAQTVLGMAIATGFTKSGPGGFVSVMDRTRTFVFGTTGGSASNAVNLSLSGASIPTLTTGSWFNILDFTGSTGNLLVTTVNIANTINLAVGGTYSNVTSNMVDTASIIGNSKTLDAITVLSGTTTISGTVTATPTTVNGGTFTHDTGATLNATIFTLTSGTVNLNGGTLPVTTTFTHTLGTVNITVSTALAATSTYTLTAGTLSLSDGVTLSTGIFSSTNTNTRSIAFGDTADGYISLTHTTAATARLSMAIATGFTYSGPGGFTSSMGVTATFTFGTTGGTSSNAPTLYINGGAAIPTFTTGSWFNLLDFTGNTSTPAATVLNLNTLTLASGGTYTSLGATMVGTGTVTPNGKTIAAFGVNNGAGTTTLAGALGCTTYTQTAGTIDFATFNLTGSGAAAYTSGTLNNIGTITCTTWTVTGAFTFGQGTITPSTSFVLTSGSFTYNVGATLSAVPTFTHTAGTVTLNQSYALTATGTYTFTAGTLTLGANLTTGIFSSLITNARAIAFDSNYIYLVHSTAGQTVLNVENANLSWTGTGGFSSAMTVTRTFKAGGTPNTLSAGVNLFITSGSAAITITAGDWYSTLDFTGSTSTATVTASSVNVTTLVLGGGTYGFNVTTYNSGTLNANGKTIGALVIGNNAYTLAPTVTTLLGAVSCSTCAIATIGSPTFDFSSYNLTCSSTFSYPAGTLSNIGTITCTTFTINGPTLNLTSGTINPSTSFVLTAGSFTLGSGANLGSVPTFTHTIGAVTLDKNYSLTATGTYTFTAGTLTLGGDLTTGTFSSTNTNVRSIAFGNNNIILSHTTAAQIVLNMANQTNFSYTGTGGFTSPMTVTRTFTSGNTAAGQPVNLALTSGASVPTLTTGSNYNILDFTGSSTTPPVTLLNIVSGLKLSDGGTYTGLHINLTGETSITGNNKTIASMNLVNGTSNTIVDTTGLNVANAVTMTQGSLVLSGNLSSNSFATAGSSRTITGSNTTYTITGSSTNAWVYSPTGSASLTGTSSQYLSITANNAFNFGTSEFTLECWVYPITYVSNAATASEIIDFWSAASPNYIVGQNQLQLNSTGTVIFYYASSATVAVPITTTATVPLNAWTHIAVSRVGTTITIYFNGVSVASGTTSQTIGSTTGAGSIGRQTVTNNLFFNGYISNVRIVKGVGVYTGNFTVPKGPLDVTQTANPYGGSNTAAITGTETSLLLNTRNYYDFITDSSTNNFTVTNNNGVRYNAISPAFTTGTPGFTGTGFTIKMTGGAKTFSGGGGTYPTLDSYGGSLSITGTNTFDDIKNSSGGGIVTFPSGITQTFNNFNLSGSSTGGGAATGYPLGSVSLNGTTQYLTAAYNLSLVQWWDTDYTIEMWIYNNTNAQTAAGLPLQIGYGLPTALGTYWAFGTNAAGNLFFYYYNGVAVNTAVSSSTVPLNSWNHVTMVYTNSNTTLTGYINGVQAFSIAKSGTPQAPSGNTLNIGSIQNVRYNGYISNIRIVRGVAVYTGNFTVPVNPISATQSAGTNIAAITGTQTSLLLNTPNSANFITDSSVNNFTVTNVGTVTANSLSPFLCFITSSTPGSAATLYKSSGIVSVNSLSIKDSTATGGASWYAGAYSVNVSNNTGWIFSGIPSSVSYSNFFAFF